jgi:hypothetical protein
MSLGKKAGYIAVLFLLFLWYPSEAGRNSEIFVADAYYEYEVSFFGLPLGSIKITTGGIEQKNGKEALYAKAQMDSYSGIPYVDLHATFESWMAPNAAHSYMFNGNMKMEDDKWQYNNIIFDHDKNEIRSTIWENKLLVSRDTFSTAKKFSDGASLLYLSRSFLELGKTAHVPTFINNQLVNTKINFQKKQEKIELDAVKGEVKALYLDGKADWEGVYGLSGSFEGWFSDDEAHIPLKAYMKVYVGKVKIELVKWKRPGWNPPKA